MVPGIFTMAGPISSGIEPAVLRSEADDDKNGN